MKWKYKILRLPSYDVHMEDKINNLGEEGWELVGLSVTPSTGDYTFTGEYTFIFKKGGEKMKAKDTVMKITKPIVDKYSHTEKYEVGGYDCPITVNEKEWDLNGLLSEQAELSFKAGIKEVVEFYKQEQIKSYGYPLSLNANWQAKLKSWGL